MYDSHNIHTHTHTHIYMCVCACVWVYVMRIIYTCVYMHHTKKQFYGYLPPLSHTIHNEQNMQVTARYPRTNL